MANRFTVNASVSATIKPDWTLADIVVTDTGNVSVRLPAGLVASRPIKLYVIFAAGTAIPGGTGQFLIANYPGANVVVPEDNGVDVVLNLTVLGLAPGPYKVLFIGEYLP
jgi:hypothetical protein